MIDYYGEIKDGIENGYGCMILNLGVYFPYANQDDLKMDFSLDVSEQCVFGSHETVMNHRYPNHLYTTLSRKYGRKYSKFGYPCFFDLDNQPKELRIKFHISGLEATIVIPLEMTLTEDKPVCTLDFIQFDTKGFTIDTFDESDGHRPWTNIPESENPFPYYRECAQMMKVKFAEEDTHTITYDIPVTVCPQTVERIVSCCY